MTPELTRTFLESINAFERPYNEEFQTIIGKRLCWNTTRMMQMCRIIAVSFNDGRVDTVIVPPGESVASLGSCVAYQLFASTSAAPAVNAVQAEHQLESDAHEKSHEVKFVIDPEAIQFVTGKNVLVVDFNPSRWAEKTIELVQKLNGIVVGFGCIGRNDKAAARIKAQRVMSVLEPLESAILQ